MRVFLAVFLFVRAAVFAVQTDFDVAVIGSSPVCLLEAISHIAKNERVLILEADPRLGGAWKAIDMCGVHNVDLGCHLIGGDVRLKSFFESYFGCAFTCLQHPGSQFNDNHLRCSNGFYFAGGCQELISRLQGFIERSRNAQVLHRNVESVYFDPGREFVEVSLGDARYSASKLYMPQMAHFRVENSAFPNQQLPKHHYYHLYFMVEDTGPSRFTYMNGIASGMSRAMNLTPFAEMPRPGLQLIVIQTHNVNELKESQKFLEAFKSKGLLSPDARIVESESCTYSQLQMNTSQLQQTGGSLIEVLDTSSFGGMVRYLDRWKSSMSPHQGN